MPLGSTAQTGHLGSRDGLLEEYFGLDPTIAPGLQRPIGWRVLKPDGTGAWDKVGAGATAWTPVSVGGGGIASITAGTGIASTGGANPTLSNTGLLSAAVGVGLSSTGGQNPTFANTGVLSFQGAAGAILFYPTAHVPNITALVALPATIANGYDVGSMAQVDTVDDIWVLRTSALATDGITVVNNAARAGTQWVRLMLRNPNWSSQVAWVIDPANSSGLASDENTGADAAHPLLTYSEHARRLNAAAITIAMTVRVMPGTQQAADKPIYTCNVVHGGSMIYTGDLTSIYAGAVTTYVAGAAAPSVDDGYTMIDATVPVSFTASGLMADGVLFKRTNGTAAYWWAAKDMGGAAPAAKARISVPCTATGRSAIALANGDSYQASALPTVTFMRFVIASESQGVLNGVVFQQFVFATGQDIAPNNIVHINCFDQGSFYSGALFENSAFKGSVIFRPLGPAPVNCYFGLLRSGAALQITGGPLVQWNGRLVGQNATVHPTSACSLQFTADLAGYDLAAGSILVADYWSIVFFQNGAFCGNNNAGNTVVWANKWSQITFLVASLAAAGSFTGPTPYSVGGTPYTPAQVDAGTANQLATKGNGIYPTT